MLTLIVHLSRPHLSYPIPNLTYSSITRSTFPLARHAVYVSTSVPMLTDQHSYWLIAFQCITYCSNSFLLDDYHSLVIVTYPLLPVYKHPWMQRRRSALSWSILLALLRSHYPSHSVRFLADWVTSTSSEALSLRHKVTVGTAPSLRQASLADTLISIAQFTCLKTMCY